MAKVRGRPLKRRYAPRLDATAEEIAKAMFKLPADYQWEYTENAPDYRCSSCGREVHYPDTLSRDYRCSTCG